MQWILQQAGCRPGWPVQYEPMFVLTKRIAAAGADLFDLALEFATLGEYGLEYPDLGGDQTTCRTAPDSRECRTTQRGRRMDGAPRPQIRDRTAIGLPEALQPPRLRLECLSDY